MHGSARCELLPQCLDKHSPCGHRGGRDMLFYTQGIDGFALCDAALDRSKSCSVCFSSLAGLPACRLATARPAPENSFWVVWDSPFRNQELRAVTFVNTRIGWAVGSDGTILATRNGGTSWEPQHSGPGTLYGVHFADAQTGWAVGLGGAMLHAARIYFSPRVPLAPAADAPKATTMADGAVDVSFAVTHDGAAPIRKIRVEAHAARGTGRPWASRSRRLTRKAAGTHAGNPQNTRSRRTARLITAWPSMMAVQPLRQFRSELSSSSRQTPLLWCCGAIIAQRYWRR